MRRAQRPCEGSTQARRWRNLVFISASWRRRWIPICQVACRNWRRWAFFAPFLMPTQTQCGFFSVTASHACWEPDMPVSCVIVGLIRSDDLFEQSLTVLDRLRSEGLISRIIISTWNEELRDNPSVSNLANKYKCDLVSRPDPGTGHGPGSELTSSMAPQTLGLRQALMAVDDDDIVLKMRPDVVLNEVFLKNLLISSRTA